VESTSAFSFLGMLMWFVRENFGGRIS